MRVRSIRLDAYFESDRLFAVAFREQLSAVGATVVRELKPEQISFVIGASIECFEDFEKVELPFQPDADIANVEFDGTCNVRRLCSPPTANSELFYLQ